MLQAHLNDPPPSLAPDLDGLFARAMAKDREDRYPTGAALTSDLREAIAGGAPGNGACPNAPSHSGARNAGRLAEATALAMGRRARSPCWSLWQPRERRFWATRDSKSSTSSTSLAPFVDRVENVLEAIRVGPAGDRPRAERRSRMQGF